MRAESEISYGSTCRMNVCKQTSTFTTVIDAAVAPTLFPTPTSDRLRCATCAKRRQQRSSNGARSESHYHAHCFPGSLQQAGMMCVAHADANYIHGGEKIQQKQRGRRGRRLCAHKAESPPTLKARRTDTDRRDAADVPCRRISQFQHSICK